MRVLKTVFIKCKYKLKYLLFFLQLLVFGLFENVCFVLADDKKTTTQTITSEQISQKFQSAVKWIQGILLVLAVVSVLIYFVLPHITGGEEGAAKGRKALKGIMIGLIVGVLVMPLVGTVYSWFV